MADLGGDARRALREARPGTLRLARDAELERQAARRGLPVGNDPHADAARRTTRPRTSSPPRSRPRSQRAPGQYLDLLGYANFLRDGGPSRQPNERTAGARDRRGRLRRRRSGPAPARRRAPRRSLLRPGSDDWRLPGVHVELRSRGRPARPRRRSRRRSSDASGRIGSSTSRRTAPTPGKRTREGSSRATCSAPCTCASAASRAGSRPSCTPAPPPNTACRITRRMRTEAPAPNSSYAVAKVAATLLCRQLSEQHGLRMRTLRLYSVYGPWEDPRRLMPTLAAYGMRGELPPLVDPETARDFVHVEDVLDAFMLAAAGDVRTARRDLQRRIRTADELARARVQIVPARRSTRRPQPRVGYARCCALWDVRSVWIARSCRDRARSGLASANGPSGRHR